MINNCISLSKFYKALCWKIIRIFTQNLYEICKNSDGVDTKGIFNKTHIENCEYVVPDSYICTFIFWRKCKKKTHGNLTNMFRHSWRSFTIRRTHCRDGATWQFRVEAIREGIGRREKWRGWMKNYLKLLLMFCPSWFCTIIYYIITFTELCKTLIYLSY